MLLLVTSIVTVPVRFEFYMPDLELTAWNKLDKRLKEEGVPKGRCPSKLTKNEKYPRKQKIGLRLLESFHHHHSQIKVKCVIADAFYGTDDFITRVSNILGGIQVISQLRKNQNIRFRNKEMSISSYFSMFPGIPQKIKIRSGEEITVIIDSARLYVSAHEKKLFYNCSQI